MFALRYFRTVFTLAPAVTPRVRLRLEECEPREVPALTAFTFSLGDGSYGSGSFDYADGQVNPSLASQQIAAFDVQLAINGNPVTIEEVWSVPLATFSNGQLRGVGFEYDVAAGNYDVLAVTTSSAMAVTLAGDLTQGSVSVVGVPPLTEIPAAPTDIVQLDLAAAVAAYNTNVANLAPLLTRMQQEMAAFDALTPLWKDALLKSKFGATQAQRDAAFKLYNSLIAQQIGHFLTLGTLQNDYNNRYDTVVTQQRYLQSLLPVEQWGTLSPIPERFFLPDQYTIPPGVGLE